MKTKSMLVLAGISALIQAQLPAAEPDPKNGAPVKQFSAPASPVKASKKVTTASLKMSEPLRSFYDKVKAASRSAASQGLALNVSAAKSIGKSQ